MELPQEFIDRTKPLMGEEWDAFVSALSKKSPTSIRINPSKSAELVGLEPVPWCNGGYYLEERPQFTFDPMLHVGKYYVQEASSMFVQLAANQLFNGDLRVLDLCAAPGGKSTLLSSALSSESLLVSNEIIKSRANILSENLMKWGNPNTIVCNNKPEDFTNLKHFFDAILVDAPCSGEGMFRKDAQAIEEWSVDNVLLCANRQKDILSSIWNTLKPGGYLFYSTCTYNREENEDIVSWLCDEYNANVISLSVSEAWGVTKSTVKNGDTYHFYPHKTKGEGFYFSVLQKDSKEEIDSKIFRPKKEKKSKQKPINLGDFIPSLENATQYKIVDIEECIYALPNHILADVDILRQHLKIISQGVCLGKIKGKDFIPHQALALSNALDIKQFNVADINWETAISYLRSEVLTLSETVDTGYILLKYKNIPLGFVKNLGNRANNLYPKEWRIRSSNIPESEILVI